MMRLSPSACVLAVSSLAALSGCAGPSLRVVGAELVESTDQGSVVEFVLTATNGTADALPLRDVSYQASAGAWSFNGHRAGEATLRATGEQQIVIPASFPGRVNLGDSASISGSMGYVEPGALAAELFDLGVYRPSVGFAGSAVVQEPPPPARLIRTTPVLKRADAPSTDKTDKTDKGEKADKPN